MKVAFSRGKKHIKHRKRVIATRDTRIVRYVYARNYY